MEAFPRGIQVSQPPCKEGPLDGRLDRTTTTAGWEAPWPPIGPRVEDSSAPQKEDFRFYKELNILMAGHDLCQWASASSRASGFSQIRFLGCANDLASWTVARIANMSVTREGPKGRERRGRVGGGRSQKPETRLTVRAWICRPPRRSVPRTWPWLQASSCLPSAPGSA